MFDGQSAGDQLWRPTEANVLFDIVSNTVVLEPLPPTRFEFALISSLLGPVRQVIASVNRRGVSSQLPRKGAGTSV